MRLFIALCLFVMAPLSLTAHCQLPCGIYHDDLEFASLEQDIETLSKAIKEIKSSDADVALTLNQRVRAVILKDEYANRLANTITFYFLQQRLDPSKSQFPQQLSSAFKILQLCAKVKASVDAGLVSQLQNEIDHFKMLYNQK